MRPIDKANKNARKFKSLFKDTGEVNLNPQHGPYNYSKKEKEYIKSKGGLQKAINKAKK